ncbi:DNA damage responsive protein [Sparganum proliferum]
MRTSRYIQGISAASISSPLCHAVPEAPYTFLAATGGLLQEMEKRAHSVLTPSSYSASSVYQDHEDSMAHRAHLDVFNSQDETPRAWCPARPVQDGLTEWLQIEFDSLKLVKMLITRGRGPNTGEFVPAFYMKYQRDNGDWYDYVSGTGQRYLASQSALREGADLVDKAMEDFEP